MYRRFVPTFARIAAPLNPLMAKKAPTSISLDDAQMKAFEDLRQRLLKAPILALPRHGAPYKLDTDACAYQVGCCLLQEQEDRTWHPIGYFSRSLTDAERNYSASERECLAVVWGVLMLRPYLLGTQFTVRTDHHALRWLLNLTDVSGRLARWRLRLAEYDFEVEYRPGVKHQLADGMSRLRTGDDPEEIEDEIPTFAVETDGGELTISDPTYVRATDADEQISGYFLPPESESDGVCTLEEQTDVVPVTADELLTAQAEDPFCQEKSNSVGDPKSQFEFDRYGFLVRRSRLDGTWAKVVPASLRDRILYLAHYTRLSGHPGGIRMYYTLRREFYWPQMANDAFAVVGNCASCAQVRGTRYKAQKFLQLFPASGPLEFVAMDILGDLTRTSRHNRFVLVITDRFSKLTVAIPLRTITAAVVADAFLSHWVFKYGAPKYLLTDNGKQFAAKFFDSVCGLLGVRHYFTAFYHPQTNGQTERFNKTIMERLRHFAADHQTDWDLYIQPLTYAYNMQVHRSTGTTPFDLILSRHPPSIAIRDVPQDSEDVPDRTDTVAFKRYLLRRVRKVLARASARNTAAQQRYKDDFDKKVRFRPVLHPGDEVFIDRPPQGALASDKEDLVVDDYIERVSKKLLMKSHGPYKLVSVTERNVMVQADGLLRNVSIDRITKKPTTASVSSPQPGRQPPIATPTTSHSASNNRAVVADPHPPSMEEVGTSARPAYDIPETDNQPEDPDTTEYVIDKLVPHSDTVEGRFFKVRLYGYGPQADEWLPERDIPENIVALYWRSVRRKAARTRPPLERGEDNRES